MRFTRWDQQWDSHATQKAAVRLALRHLGLADCKDSHEIQRLIAAGDFRAVCSYELNYADLSLESALHLRQALAFFQKRQDLRLVGVDPRKAAHEKFEEAERLCSETNQIFRMRLQGKFAFPPDVEGVLYTAQRKIARILGPVPLLGAIRPRFGPGATTQVKKRDASARLKLAQGFACSEELAPIASCCLAELQGWVFSQEDSDIASVPVHIHDGIQSFVPKNAKTDRTIVIEPMLNGMFQLGIGDYIARRLEREGVDITDQTRNQALAREGSVSGALATLDLSSASDTIARELVYDLLPLDWAHFLSRFRTAWIVRPDGSRCRQEKFSSMGNGFTFPLETLIFYALAKACCVDDPNSSCVSVYGDDIIVPVSRYQLLTKVLKAAGFIPNASKSFADGPFRESCGKDYYLGSDIRPFYLKGHLSGRVAFTLHNFYARRGWLDMATTVLDLIDPSLRIWGPDGYGDGHLIGIHRRVQKREHLDKGWCGYIFDTFVDKPVRKFNTFLPGDRVLPSYSIYVAPPPGGLWVESRASNFLGRRRLSAIRHYSLGPERGLAYQYRKEALGVVLPGSKGYRRISVYTLG